MGGLGREDCLNKLQDALWVGGWVGGWVGRTGGCVANDVPHGEENVGLGGLDEVGGGGVLGSEEGALRVAGGDLFWGWVGGLNALLIGWVGKERRDD